jgi:hypothetical protein
VSTALRIRSRPPSGIARSALSIRLVHTWFSSAGWAGTVTHQPRPQNTTARSLRAQPTSSPGDPWHGSGRWRACLGRSHSSRCVGRSGTGEGAPTCHRWLHSRRRRARQLPAVAPAAMPRDGHRSPRPGPPFRRSPPILPCIPLQRRDEQDSRTHADPDRRGRPDDQRHSNRADESGDHDSDNVTESLCLTPDMTGMMTGASPSHGGKNCASPQSRRMTDQGTGQPGAQSGEDASAEFVIRKAAGPPAAAAPPCR